MVFFFYFISLIVCKYAGNKIDLLLAFNLLLTNSIFFITKYSNYVEIGNDFVFYMADCKSVRACVFDDGI